MTIQVKAIEQYFPVVLFITLHKVVLTFESLDEILKRTIQMKFLGQYFPVVLFIILHKVVLRFASVNEILKCHHSNERSSTKLSNDANCFSQFYKEKFGNFLEFWPRLGVGPPNYSVVATCFLNRFLAIVVKGFI